MRRLLNYDPHFQTLKDIETLATFELQGIYILYTIKILI